MITVKVHLHTILQLETPDGLINRLDLQIPEGSSVGLVLEELNIDLPSDALILAINGRVVDEEKILINGDRLDLMPAISGGRNCIERS